MAFTSKKIILAEDDSSLLDVYRQMFKEADYDIEVASTVSELSEELRLIRMGHSQKPDLIILDMMHPNVGGVEILKSIKKSCLTKDIPVFVMSNYHNPDLHCDLERQNIFPEKYLIKTNHTPAQILGIINNHFLIPTPKTKLA